MGGVFNEPEHLYSSSSNPESSPMEIDSPSSQDSVYSCVPIHPSRLVRAWGASNDPLDNVKAVLNQVQKHQECEHTPGDDQKSPSPRISLSITGNCHNPVEEDKAIQRTSDLAIRKTVSQQLFNNTDSQLGSTRKPQRPKHDNVSNIRDHPPMYAASHNLRPVEESSLEMDDRRHQPDTSSVNSVLKSGRGECSIADDEDIFCTLPRSALSQIMFDRDSSALGGETCASQCGVGFSDNGKGKHAPGVSGGSLSIAYSKVKGNGRKRKRLSPENEDEEDLGESDDRQGTKLQSPYVPQLCPEYVANPSGKEFAPGGSLFHSCTLKHILKMPQHLQRIHTKPVQCEICGYRGDAGQVTAHKKSDGCQRQHFDPVPREDKKKADLLKRNARSSWEEVFKMQIGADVSSFPQGEIYMACRQAAPELSRSFLEFLEPRWPLIIKDYYESSLYRVFSENHPEVNFGPDDGSRTRSEIEGFFVKRFLFAFRPPQQFEAATPANYPKQSFASSPDRDGITPSLQRSLSSLQADNLPQNSPLDFTADHSCQISHRRPALCVSGCSLQATAPVPLCASTNKPQLALGRPPSESAKSPDRTRSVAIGPSAPPTSKGEVSTHETQEMSARPRGSKPNMCINLEYDQEPPVSSQYQQSVQARNGHSLIQPQSPDLYHKVPSGSTFEISQPAPFSDTSGLPNAFDDSMNVNPMTSANYRVGQWRSHQSSETPQATTQSTPTRQVDTRTPWEYLPCSSISYMPTSSSAEALSPLRHIGSSPPGPHPNLDNEPRQDHGSLPGPNCNMDDVGNYFYGDGLAADQVNDIQGLVEARPSSDAESSEHWFNQ